MKENNSRVWITVTIILSIIIVGGIIFISTKSTSTENVGVTGEVTEDFEDEFIDDSGPSFLANIIKNCYEEQVPYEELETYTETVPYEAEIELKYNWDNSVEYNCGSIFDYYGCMDIGIENIDTVGGIFSVKCKIRTLNDELYDTKETYIKPGDTEKITCGVDISAGDDFEVTYTITPPTKTETKYKEVERTRTITKYRTVTVCD